MSDPTGGAVAYEGDSALFDKLADELPDEPTPEVPASADAAPEAAEAPATSAVVRDDLGRFAKDAPAPAADAAPPRVAPTVESPAPPSTEPTGPDLSQYPPYEYRGPNGQSVSIPGAVRGSDGVLFGKDSVPILERKLAEAESAHERLSQMGRKLADSNSRAERAEAEKNEVLQRMTEIMQDPAKFDAWAQDTQGNWEKLVLQAQLKMATEQRDGYVSQRNQEASEQEVQALIPRLHRATEDAVRQLAAYDEFRDLGLDAAWQADFKQRMMASRFNDLFTDATAADVQAGIATQVGETIFHPEPLLAEMRYQAGFVRNQLARQRSLVEAQTRNARVAQAAPIAPTAGARPAGTPSATPKPALKPGMSKQEVDKLVFETLMD